MVQNAIGKRVILDESAFYSSDGGQPCDFGKIYCNGADYVVTSVTKNDGIEVDIQGMKTGDIVHWIGNAGTIS